MLFTTYFSSFGDCPPAQPIYSLITSGSFLSISVQLRPIIIQAHVAAKSDAAPPVLRACLSWKIPRDNLPSAWMSSRWKIALRYIIKSAAYLHWLSKRGVGRCAPKRSSIELNGEEQKQTRTKANKNKNERKEQGKGRKGQHCEKVPQRIWETKRRTTTK